MKFQRAVIYEVEADDLEEALDKWDADGPEVGSEVEVMSSSDFEEVV